MIDLDELRAEIEQFKTEAMKMHIVQVWAESYQNSNPFGHIVDDRGVFWIKAQAYQLWKFWQSAKQSKQSEVDALKAQLVKVTNVIHGLYPDKALPPLLIFGKLMELNEEIKAMIDSEVSTND